MVAADGVRDLVRAQHLALAVNGRLVWGWFGPWLWIYLAITALVYGWYCLPYIRRMIRRQRGAVQDAREISEIH